jgi:hypothetical protein
MVYDSFLFYNMLIVLFKHYGLMQGNKTILAVKIGNYKIGKFSLCNFFHFNFTYGD